MVNAFVKRPGRPSSRQVILEAAADVIAEVGAGHLTLEAVATRAGVSKGGLLYNFPTKTKLLEGLLEEHLAPALALVEESGEQRGGDLIRSLLQRKFECLCGAATDRTMHGIIAAATEQPELLEPVRRIQRAIWAASQTATNPEQLWLVWLATEGMLFGEMFSVCPLSAEERKRIFAELDRMLDALLPETVAEPS